MVIRLAGQKDAREIAKIHKEEIGKGFLSSLPLAFLEKLYSAAIESDFVVVAEEGGKIIGFMAGTADIKKLYSNFLKKYFFHSVIFLFFKIFSFSSLRKILENLLYPKKEQDLPKAELLTVAVIKEFQGKGLAGEILEVFLREMKNKGIKIFKVVVGEELKPAIKFYEKNGFKFVKNIALHGNDPSHVYTFTL